MSYDFTYWVTYTVDIMDEMKDIPLECISCNSDWPFHNCMTVPDWTGEVTYIYPNAPAKAVDIYRRNLWGVDDIYYRWKHPADADHPRPYYVSYYPEGDANYDYNETESSKEVQYLHVLGWWAGGPDDNDVDRRHWTWPYYGQQKNEYQDYLKMYYS